MSTASPTSSTITREERKVLAGTLVGTTIEWYDFFIYAQAAGLILSVQYFGPLAADNPALGQIMAWASLGISFLFRPLGAIIAGHLGDRIGRKRMLVLTLILMGAATSLIGLLPTYAAIGVAAPILLTLLAHPPGLLAGGEWGGAALLSVEHAPDDKRGIFGAYPQIGVPVGMILATGVIWILTTVLTPEQFASFGWRIPFLFSVVLVVVGYYIRKQVEESPVFAELAERRAESSAPLGTLFRKNTKEVVLAAVIFIGNNAVGYMIIAFFAAYASRPSPRAAWSASTAPRVARDNARELRLADLHDVGRGALRPARSRPHLPDRLHPPHPLAHPDVPHDRFQEHLDVRHRHLRPHRRHGAQLRPDVGDVRGDVPAAGPLLRSVDRVCARRDPRRGVRPDHRRDPAREDRQLPVDRDLPHHRLRHLPHRRQPRQGDEGKPLGVPKHH